MCGRRQPSNRLAAQRPTHRAPFPTSVASASSVDEPSRSTRWRTGGRRVPARRPTTTSSACPDFHPPHRCRIHARTRSSSDVNWKSQCQTHPLGTGKFTGSTTRKPWWKVERSPPVLTHVTVVVNFETQCSTPTSSGTSRGAKVIRTAPWCYHAWSMYGARHCTRQVEKESNRPQRRTGYRDSEARSTSSAPRANSSRSWKTPSTRVVTGCQHWLARQLYFHHSPVTPHSTCVDSSNWKHWCYHWTQCCTTWYVWSCRCTRSKNQLAPSSAAPLQCNPSCSCRGRSQISPARSSAGRSFRDPH